MLTESDAQQQGIDERYDNPVIRRLFLRVVSLTEILIVLGFVVTAFVFCLMLVHYHYFSKYVGKYPKTARTQLVASAFDLLVFVLNLVYYIKASRFVKRLKRYATGSGTVFDLETAFIIQVRLLKVAIVMSVLSIAYSIFALWSTFA